MPLPPINTSPRSRRSFPKGMGLCGGCKQVLLMRTADRKKLQAKSQNIKQKLI